MDATPSTLAGKSFRWRAPALIAVKASLTVATPGKGVMPRSTARAMTDGSQLGDTMICAPARRQATTSSGVSTVPAPTVARSPSCSRKMAIDASGDGELSGTSSVVMPPASTASPISAASSGRSPRRIAIRPSVPIASPRLCRPLLPALSRYSPTSPAPTAERQRPRMVTSSGASVALTPCRASARW